MVYYLYFFQLGKSLSFLFNNNSITTLSSSDDAFKLDISVDDSKKIGVIVNKDLIVTDVLEKNYFPSPYYGVEIRFVDE